MGTITETGTFAPLVQLWKTPMRPDNTPVQRGAPIGRVTWFASDVTAAKLTTDIVELAISCSVPSNFALQLMNIQWSMQLVTADAIADVNDWADMALLTVPTGDQTLNYELRKNQNAVQATITNFFVNNMFGPSVGGSDEGSSNIPIFKDPFIPTTGIIFRVTNISANASAAMTWFSHMWANLYTIEQYQQHSIWTPTHLNI